MEEKRSEDQSTVNGKTVDEVREKEVEMRSKISSLLNAYGVSEFTIVYRNKGCLGVSSYVKNQESMLAFSGFLQAFATNAVLKGADIQTKEK